MSDVGFSCDLFPISWAASLLLRAAPISSLEILLFLLWLLHLCSLRLYAVPINFATIFLLIYGFFQHLDCCLLLRFSNYILCRLREREEAKGQKEAIETWKKSSKKGQKGKIPEQHFISTRSASWWSRKMKIRRLSSFFPICSIASLMYWEGFGGKLHGYIHYAYTKISRWIEDGS